MMSRSRRTPSFLENLVMFIAVAALAGALVAGLVVPFAGVLGLTAKSMTDSFHNLSGDLQDPPLPERSLLLAVDGTVIATFYDQNRVEVKLDQVAPVMQHAILAIEDARFYHHGPLDMQGTLRAFVRNQQGGGVSQGGSSITQQYVKLVLFENAETPDEQGKVIEESYSRKLQELRYAVELEKTMTKDEILGKYFNIVYFGDGAYGIESAAKYYFSTTAAKLTLPQAAMLAGLVRDPNGLDVRQKPKDVLNRRNLVLSRMAHEGMISQKQRAAAAKTGLGLHMAKFEQGCYYSKYPFFCDYVQAVLLSDPALGKSEEERRRLLYRGGLVVQSTLDVRAQDAAQKAVSETVAPTDLVHGALSMVEPGTGAIKAMAQSRGYGQGKGKTYVNINVPQRYGGGIGFSPGSTYKPFVLAAAIRQGMPITERLPSPSRTAISRPVKNCPEGKPGYNSAFWSIGNSTSAGSTSDMISGTGRSVNTYYANLEAETGICEPAEIATKLGAVRADGQPLLQIKPFTIGVNEIAPLSMAEAYATFAARGMHCRAVPFTRVLDRDSNPLPVRGPECEQVISRHVADTVNYVLRQVVDGKDSGRTGQAMSMKSEGRQVAGKTGTSESRKAVWFMGYTTNMVAAAAVADAHPVLRSLLGAEINGRRVGGDQVLGWHARRPDVAGVHARRSRGQEEPELRRTRCHSGLSWSTAASTSSGWRPRDEYDS